MWAASRVPVGLRQLLEGIDSLVRNALTTAPLPFTLFLLADPS